LVNLFGGAPKCSKTCGTGRSLERGQRHRLPWQVRGPAARIGPGPPRRGPLADRAAACRRHGPISRSGTAAGRDPLDHGLRSGSSAAQPPAAPQATPPAAPAAVG